MRNGMLYPRRRLGPGISERGSGLLPSLTAGAGLDGGSGAPWKNRPSRALLLTLSAQSYGTNQGGGMGRVGPVRESLETMARNGRLPTLTSSDGRKGWRSRRYGDGTPTLGARLGGTLNPEWAEWYMGWPIGWTGLQPLEMGRFVKWLAKHGKG